MSDQFTSFQTPGMHSSEENMDPGDRGEASGEKREKTALTPTDLEKDQLQKTQAYAEQFEQTELADQSQEFRFNKKKTSERKLKLKDVQHGEDNEDLAKKDARVEEKTRLVMEQALSDLVVARKKYNEISQEIVNLIPMIGQEKLDNLYSTRDKLKSLHSSVVGVANFYFNSFIGTVKQYRQVYPDQYSDVMFGFLDEYYTQTTKDKTGLSKNNDLLAVLTSDINELVDQETITNTLEVVEKYIQSQEKKNKEPEGSDVGAQKEVKIESDQPENIQPVNLEEATEQLEQAPQEQQTNIG